MSAPTLVALIERFRQTLELEALEVDETGTVDLIVDSHLNIRIQELPEQGCLVLTAGLGTIPPGKPIEEVYHGLLQGNFRGLLTVGGILSLSSELNPEVELAVREPLAGMEYERFEAVLEDFISCAEYWTDYLAGSSANSSESSAEPPADTDTEFIRV
ncbi:MAG: type III secretion system chaperone [Verrucomicrobia bacterium]|nr:type III secretion system chaperone [Verrucomicrobiota bacterium]